MSKLPKKKHKKYKGLLGSLDNALKKLHEYYRLLTACPVYYVAMSLNPAIKFSMFKNWTEDPSLRENWVKVKKDIRDFG
jgi:hypothetical protein